MKILYRQFWKEARWELVDSFIHFVVWILPKQPACEMQTKPWPLRIVNRSESTGLWPCVKQGATVSIPLVINGVLGDSEMLWCKVPLVSNPVVIRNAIQVQSLDWDFLEMSWLQSSRNWSLQDKDLKWCRREICYKIEEPSSDVQTSFSMIFWRSLNSYHSCQIASVKSLFWSTSLSRAFCICKIIKSSQFYSKKNGKI